VVINNSTAVRPLFVFLAALVLAGFIAAALSRGAESALAHTGEALDVPGLTEAELREAETQALGPTHAAEHARQRALAAEQAPPPTSTSSAASAAALRVAGPASEVGQWNAPFEIPTVGIHAVMLPTGKVMYWSNVINDVRGDVGEAWLWNPANGQSRRVDPPLINGKPANIFCSSQSLLADGRVLLVGGSNAWPDSTGAKFVFTFNPFNETWTRQPDMPRGRWYPTQVTLQDGRVLIIGGLDENPGGTIDTDIELFTPSADPNGVGTIVKIGTEGGSGPPTGGLYPHMFVMPSGRTLVAGPYPQDSWYANGVSPFSWSDAANFAGTERYLGSGVLAPGGPSGSSIVTLLGGGTGTTPGGGPDAKSSAISFNETTSNWTSAPPLQIARTHHNTVLLPDSSMVTVGGGVGDADPGGLWQATEEQKQVELYDPATQSWRLGASQAENRAYHSTALLLPDGRVISAGDEFNGPAGADRAEIYEPPYLFKGSRPAISSAPPSVRWGDDFGIYSPDSVSRAVLVAAGATTHANDMQQRHVELALSGGIGGVGVNVLAPSTSAIAPPGYYMLFLLNAQGVPSAAKWVRLDPNAPDRPPVVRGPGVTLGGGKVKGSIKAKGKNLLARISCQLPAGSADPCAGEITVTATTARGSAKSAKRSTIASGRYSIPSGSTRQVKLRLTKRGRALIRKKGSLKATVTLTNELNNSRAGFRVKL
jgi:hypothetical protein